MKNKTSLELIFSVSRPKKIGSTLPWCWTGCSCGSSRWPWWWALPGSSSRLRVSTMTEYPLIRCSLTLAFRPGTTRTKELEVKEQEQLASELIRINYLMLMISLCIDLSYTYRVFHNLQPGAGLTT